MRKITSNIFSTLFILCFLAIIVILLTSRPNFVQTGANNVEPTTAASYPGPITPSPDEATSTPPVFVTETPLPTITPFATTLPTTIGELPRGEKIVFSEMRPSEINVWAVSTVDISQRQILFSVKRTTGFGIRASISPDSKFIAYTLITQGANTPFDAQLWVVDVSSGKQRLVADIVDIGRYRNYPVWSPNSLYIAFMRRQGSAEEYVDSLVVVNVESGKEFTLVEQKIADQKEAASQSIYVLDWSSDSLFLFYQVGITDTVLLRKVDIATQEVSDVGVITNSGAPRCYEFSSDKRFLACNIVTLGDAVPSPSQLAIIPTSGEDASRIGTDVTTDPVWKSNENSVSAARGSEVFTFTEKGSPITSVRVKNTQQVEPAGWSKNNSWLAIYKDPENRGSLSILSTSDAKEEPITVTSGTEFIGWLP